MSVDIDTGEALINRTDSTYGYAAWTDATTNLTIGTADGSHDRIDAVVAWIDTSVISTTQNNNPGSLKFKDVQGTPASSPVAPTSSAIQSSVGAGVPWILLAYVRVPTSATQIVTANITDERPPFAVRARLWGGSSNTFGHSVPNVADDTVVLVNTTQTVSNKTFDDTNTIISNGWQSLNATLTYSANNGNKEFVLGTSVDCTSLLSAGMKLSMVRNTTPPTQCMSFTAASSQYATKASPSGITFTGNWTGETWVYLNSYPSTTVCIIGRDSTGGSASGFEFGLTAAGTVQAFWRNGTGTSAFDTYQSIPLKRWVHIAGAVTVATPTAALYINGMLSPSKSTATNATSVVQASTDLRVAKGNNTTSYLDGYLSETRIWSVAQTQANIQANMAINLVGNETNLVALFKGGGNFNDSTSNANNLTANSGAIATQASNPYNSTEYGIVTLITSSQITISTGDTCTIPNMTLNSPQYSNADNPYGLPGDIRTMGRRLLFVPMNTQFSTSSTTPGGFAPTSGLSFTVPDNCYLVKLKIFNTDFAATSSGTAVFSFYNGSVANGNAVGQINTTTSNGYLSAEIPIAVVPGSTFTLNTNWSTTAGTLTWASGGSGSPMIQGLWIEAA